ncbi:hypothetical protein [Inovirus sp.]|nr:hypothetical protein [Inovirus sp.]QRV61721.1 hypothetical protein [Inovirus sp.]
MVAFLTLHEALVVRIHTPQPLERGVIMKNFLMRGVLLVTLLSSLVLPASAAFSNTDSQNIANIKSYTFDIKTAVTSGTLFKNISSIATSVKNISSSVSSIYTQIQATNNHLSTGNSNTSAISSNTAVISSRIGSLTNTGYRSIAEALFTLGGKLDTSNTNLTSFDSNVSTKLGSVVTNTGLISTSNSYLQTISGNSTNIKTNVSNINSSLSALENKGLSTEAKQDSIISLLGVLDTLSTESTTSNISDTLTHVFDATPPIFGTSPNLDDMNLSLVSNSVFAVLMGHMTCSYMKYYDVPSNSFKAQKTFYGHLANLSDTLASDEDKALRESQNENVASVTGQFVTGSSGGTSLGKDDFGGLSTAGSAAKDLSSLNGQASIGKFTDGLSKANTFGMGWFSSDTKNALDTVPAPSGKRARSLDSDPYNMAGFSDNYNWLFGGD